MKSISTQIDSLVDLLKKNITNKQLHQSRDNFEIVYQKITQQAFKTINVLIQNFTDDIGLKLSYSALLKQLKTFLSMKSQINDSQQQEYYTRQYDQVQQFMNSRKPINQETDAGQRGDIYKFLYQSQNKSKDIQQFMGNVNKFNANKTNKRFQLTGSKWKKTIKHLPVVITEDIQVQTQMNLLLFTKLESKLPGLFLHHQQHSQQQGITFDIDQRIQKLISQKIQQQRKLLQQQKQQKQQKQLKQNKQKKKPTKQAQTNNKKKNNNNNNNNNNKQSVAQQQNKKNPSQTNLKKDKVNNSNTVNNTQSSSIKSKQLNSKKQSVYNNNDNGQKSTNVNVKTVSILQQQQQMLNDNNITPVNFNQSKQSKQSQQSKQSKQSKSLSTNKAKQLIETCQKQINTDMSYFVDTNKQKLFPNYSSFNNNNDNTLSSSSQVLQNKKKQLLSQFDNMTEDEKFQLLKNVLLVQKRNNKQSVVDNNQKTNINQIQLQKQKSINLKTLVNQSKSSLPQLFKYGQHQHNQQNKDSASQQLLDKQCKQLENKLSQSPSSPAMQYMKRLRDPTSKDIINSNSNSNSTSKLFNKQNYTLDMYKSKQKLLFNNNKHHNNNNNNNNRLSSQHINLPSLNNRNSRKSLIKKSNISSSLHQQIINTNDGDNNNDLDNNNKKSPYYFIKNNHGDDDKKKASCHSTIDHLLQSSSLKNTYNNSRSRTNNNSIFQNTNTNKYQQQQQLIISQLTKLSNQGSIKKNLKNIAVLINCVQSIHLRKCGEKCVHLERFYGFLQRNNIPNRRELLLHKADINESVKI